MEVIVFVCQWSKALSIQSKRFSITYISIFQKIFELITCKKTRLYGYAYDFSVDYDNIDVSDVLDIRKDLMKKHNINWFRFVRKMYIGLLSLSFGRSLTCDGIECVFSKNWPCQARPTLFCYKL